MAEVTIRFRFNPTTGKRELVIGYESDTGALAHEHEKEHRALAEKLLGHPLGDDTVVRVERVQKTGAAIEGEIGPRDRARQQAATKTGD